MVNVFKREEKINPFYKLNYRRVKLARNYIDLIDEEDDFELFEKLGHTSKKFNKMNDAQEKIKQKRRQRQKMKEDAQNREDFV